MKILLLLFFLLIQSSYANPKEKRKPIGSTLKSPISISALVKHHSKGLIFETKAYVTYKYSCPPCPKGMLCKPCMGKNVIISEKAILKKNYPEVNERDMILYLKDHSSLKLGKSYLFKIRFNQVRFSSDKRTIYEGSLVSYQ